jgi:REP element-mobilizing transposase RayT
MDQAPYNLDQIRRDAVLEAIQEVCARRGWSLLAAHVRSNHVHTVVEAEVPPERAMHDFKTYASRPLNRMRLEKPNRKRWARHGSARWLWKPQHVSAAIHLVPATALLRSRLRIGAFPRSSTFLSRTPAARWYVASLID